MSRYHHFLLNVLMLTLLPLLFNTLPVFASLTCDICGKEITEGEYVILDTQHYHKTCYQKIAKCTFCKKPIFSNGIKDAGGALFHKKCYDSLPVCVVCQHVIMKGSFYTLQNGAAVHASCKAKLPLCAYCNSPILGDVAKFDGRDFHPSCLKKAHFCHVCGSPIKGSYQIDLYGRETCAAHARTSHLCAVCGYPHTKFKLQDGRELCERCNKTAVYSHQKAVTYYYEVKQFLTRNFGMSFPKHIEVTLVGLPELNPENSRDAGSERGKCYNAITTKFDGQGNILEKKMETTIKILYGLPSHLFKCVMAHELTHAWQAKNGLQEQAAALREGTAELVAYEFARRQHYSFCLKSIEQNSISLYRNGFNKARKLAQKWGFLTFLQQVKSMESF